MKQFSLINLIIFWGLSLSSLLPLGLYSTDSLIFFLGCTLQLALYLILLAKSVILICKTIKESSVAIKIVSLFAFLSFILVLVIGYAPVITRDALIHHIVVPHWWAEQGKIYPIYWHYWSFYPMLFNLGYLNLITWQCETLLTWYHAGLLLVIAALLADFSNYLKLSKISIVITWTTVFASPFFLRLGSEPLVDLALVVFSIAALLQTIRSFHLKNLNFYQAVQVGALLGFALSTKPNGMLLVGLYPVFIVLLNIHERISWKEVIKFLVKTLTAAGLVYAPWLIKNYFWTGNPFYPFFSRFFTLVSDISVEFTSKALGLYQFSQIELRIHHYGEGFWQFILLPLRMFFQGQDDQPQYFDSVINPALFVALLIFFKTKDKKWINATFILSLLYIIISMFQAPFRIRYLLPVLGLLPLWFALAFDYFYSKFKILRSHNKKAPINFPLAAWSLLIVLMWGYTGLYLYQRAVKLGVNRYYFDKQNRQAYLKEHSQEYRVASSLNHVLPYSARVYLLFSGNRYAFYKVKAFSAGYDSSAPILMSIRSSKNLLELKNRLKSYKIDYLLINLDRMQNVFSSALNESEKLLWQEFLTNYQEAFLVEGYGLWKVQ